MKNVREKQVAAESQYTAMAADVTARTPVTESAFHKTMSFVSLNKNNVCRLDAVLGGSGKFSGSFNRNPFSMVGEVSPM